MSLKSISPGTTNLVTPSMTSDTIISGVGVRFKRSAKTSGKTTKLAGPLTVFSVRCSTCTTVVGPSCSELLMRTLGFSFFKMMSCST